ncbi:tRNA pseudouridine(38-40) synthase TruA [Thiomicrorhabdus sp. 6S3-12]|uniref:tRNA pseudouridine(38-40) synthase TruA n=1 Tax=Thiomicrorhabdus sp. 6S3-12 TaxID=2819681 RepID=UPI001AAC511B|nr:tRNA pseudouridine(38-40) synthase TruA [Thiomicrorhabdus sp. 6S3-12]MBO1923505.1 tRNA pseudouridine(38-40) synthase TruA [Thiomicrorhabdus sp. 6S3-12]
MRIALGIEYQGGAYCGYQRQKHCPSVQEHLENALSSIAAERVELHCAGRTDTGVHAIGQVVHFETCSERPEKAWVQGTNTQLPADIRVVWAKPMGEDFHARFSAVARQYRYVIFNRRVHSAVLAGRVTHEPYKLDESRMHQAAQALIGEQDFSSFRAAACQASHAMREVQQVSVKRCGDFILIDIRANAFLHHMVRNIVGSLIEVGKGHQSVQWLADLLALQDRTQAAPTAPAEGLYFVNAIYPEGLGVPQTPLDQVLWQM